MAASDRSLPITKVTAEGVAESSFGQQVPLRKVSAAGSPVSFLSLAANVVDAPKGIAVEPSASAMKSTPRRSVIAVDRQKDESIAASSDCAAGKGFDSDSAAKKKDDFTEPITSKSERLTVEVGRGTTIRCISGHVEYELLCTCGSHKWKLMKRYSEILESVLLLCILSFFKPWSPAPSS